MIEIKNQNRDIAQLGCDNPIKYLEYLFVYEKYLTKLANDYYKKKIDYEKRKQYPKNYYYCCEMENHYRRASAVVRHIHNAYKNPLYLDRVFDKIQVALNESVLNKE